MALVVALSVGGFVGWIIYGATHPPQHPYLVTPEKFEQLSHRGLKATTEVWSNRDGTQARGWLLRGSAGAPGVVLLHRYGADRSWLLNLGVKLHETANFTVLWPDLRGHGEAPSVNFSSLGIDESADTLAALDYLRSLKTPQGTPQVGGQLGLYGVEMGAYAALGAAQGEGVGALALDSVPASPDELLRFNVRADTGFDNALLQLLARLGVRLYFIGSYQNTSSCTLASGLAKPRVLLLAGADAAHLRDSTDALARCFPDQSLVELHDDLPLTGFTLASAPGEQGEAYDRRVIEFFDRTLRAPH